MRECPLHWECELYLPASSCDYRSGRLTYEQACEVAEERQGSMGDTSDGTRAGND